MGRTKGVPHKAQNHHFRGGHAAKEVLLARDPDWYRNIGRLGGAAKNKTPKGFAAMPRERVQAAGRKGGSVSRRGPKNAPDS
jgi:general stress protein YciG